MDKKFDYFLEGKTGKWEVVIGLEVHAQITSNAKLFSSSSTKFGSNPNSQVSFVDAAMPGMLPVINKYCVEQAVKTGLGLKATINNFSKFDRKNYFYADLPQGYQISQFKFPIVGEGEIVLDMPYGTKIAGIERLHLEQDAGKSIHDQDPSSSFVDLNRSGIALMEIVGKPDLRSPDEVAQYVKKLRSIMRYLNTCDGNMDEGSLRADVNVSVRKVGSSDLGTRCEIKNVNSIKFMQQAIEYEAKRQIEIIEEGGTINQQTRLFDTKKIETRSMRSKEDAHDYRYFPDPDLLPLVLEQSFVDKIKNSLPELPDEKKIRLMNDFDLSSYDASIVVSDQDISQYYEEVAKDSDYKLAANWMIVELFGVLNKEGKEIKDSPVSAKNLSKLINLIKDNTISGKIAKTVFEEMVKNNEDPEKIVNEKGMRQQSDPEELKKIIDTILKNNQDKVEQYKAGKDKLFGFFVGEAMKNTQGKGNPKLINDILKEQLK
ncbi:aspartyl-tRNA(Asn) amidotransferase subunit B / Glutamyl-tRNA(Gln) amidotransferase subunit B [Candidatus Pelagibacter sp. IMCC9063]|uniref:Asp-tRNA(Asn)/Glu-tRNA(Gln) amidotransferase subunit GatB n=1 Tax=Pelagibacter sp. (strain IMCC9063) TaxID=1002672 RepID=UPI00020468B2|nr:Asp-tRNA(Asn)/Glu-tRNA(Gln) amidotransferase subunit GatB [Candidatus Pelagibacter sp. IMCC9063]AEA81657.1 aspartyl-tRNA(Asn) amidotransferase subunit B / Glutamyl-tRNA(Gln) amidotransferase subunit B [Candidatus Pelagibacter sp. IMCC9063]